MSESPRTDKVAFDFRKNIHGDINKVDGFVYVDYSFARDLELELITTDELVTAYTDTVQGLEKELSEANIGIKLLEDRLEMCDDDWKEKCIEADTLRSLHEICEQELNTLNNSGIVEVAARNSNVFDYVEHWEGRALKAEKAEEDYCELSILQSQYIKFLGEESAKTAVFLHVHGWSYPEEDIKKGEKFREDIEALKEQINNK